MGDDIHRKRAAVEGMYSGNNWKNKVRRMPDDQVIAIYLKEEAKGTFDRSSKPKEENKNDDIPF